MRIVDAGSDVVESPREPSSAPFADRSRQRARRRGLAGLALLAALLHAMLLGGAGRAAIGSDATPATGLPMTVRSIEAVPEPAAEPALASPPAPAPLSVAPPPRPRRPRSISTLTPATPARPIEAVEAAASGPAITEAPLETAALPADRAASEVGTAAGAASTPAGSVMEVAGAASAPAASSSFLSAGEAPPPTYRTKLPPSVMLRYEVRRGFLRGTGEIRWQHVGDDYGLRLEARIAGLVLLAQTSQGVVDADGLAPVRFLDQRVRRAAQAANFRRDTGTISYSGPQVVWPLLAGSQDQLSWMIQLAGIVAADPQRAREGPRIAMVIVGARGEAGVRTVRFAGEENATTASGSVPALKFMVDGRSLYDSSYEIWLDPARDYLPVHATQRNGAGESQFDLLLESSEPIP